MTMRIEVKNCDASETSGRKLKVEIVPVPDDARYRRTVATLGPQESCSDYVHSTQTVLLTEVES
jgi:hypothetical protein